MWGKDELPRMYTDLAWTWPIVSALHNYDEESELFADRIREGARGEAATLLHLGCGGGHNDHYLRRHFAVTGVDLSPEMVANARRLNPEVEYLVGDMRTLRLGRTFDAVAILDSIMYMRTEEELAMAFATAWEHLRPGGVLLTYAEITTETFEEGRVSHHAGSGGDVSVVLFEHEHDPDPEDSTFEYTAIYLVRDGGPPTVQHEVHLMGLFPREAWVRRLEDVGFSVEEVPFPEELDDAERSIPVFVCLRPFDR